MIKIATIVAGALALALIGSSANAQSGRSTTGQAPSGMNSVTGTRPSPSVSNTMMETGGKTNESGPNSTANDGGGMSGSTQGAANSSGGAR